MNECRTNTDTELQSPKYYKRIVDLFKTLANPVRLKIVDLLSHGPLCVCNIEPYFDISQAAISKHLKTLVMAEILEYKQVGAKNIYKLQENKILDFLKSADNFSENLIQIKLQRYREFDSP